jgi:hypothetical protein
MYVEMRIPANQTHRFPIIMVHGGTRTGTTYIDRDNYTVSAVFSDQTRSEPLGLRGLFEQYLLERINADG